MDNQTEHKKRFSSLAKDSGNATNDGSMFDLAGNSSYSTPAAMSFLAGTLAGNNASNSDYLTAASALTGDVTSSVPTATASETSTFNPANSIFYTQASYTYPAQELSQRFSSNAIQVTSNSLITIGCSHGIGTATNPAASEFIEVPNSNGGVNYFYADYVIRYTVDLGTGDTITNQQSQYDVSITHYKTLVPGSFNSIVPMGITTDYPGGPVTVSGFPASAGMDLISLPQTVTLTPSLSLLQGTSIGGGSSGGADWIYSNGQASIVSLNSSVAADGTGYFTQITSAMNDQLIQPALATNLALNGAAPLTVFDTSTGANLLPDATFYNNGIANGNVDPVPGVVNQWATPVNDNVNATAISPSWFLHGGTGNDGISALGGGTNVIDGGPGSNFLTGSGITNFYVDARTITPTPVWSTAVGFVPGDSATVWGVTAADFVTMLPNEGALGYQGPDYLFDHEGQLAAITVANVPPGNLSTSYGSINGTNYFTIRDTPLASFALAAVGACAAAAFSPGGDFKAAAADFAGAKMTTGESRTALPVRFQKEGNKVLAYLNPSLAAG